MTYLEELGTRTMTDEELERVHRLIDDLNPKQTQALQAYGRDEADKAKTLKELTASGIKPKDAADMVDAVIPLSPDARKFMAPWISHEFGERTREDLEFRFAKTEGRPDAGMSRESRVDVDHAARREALAAKAAFEASETLRRESLNARTSGPSPAPARAPQERAAKSPEPTRQETYAKSEQPSVPMKVRHLPPRSLALRVLKDHPAHAHANAPDRA